MRASLNKKTFNPQERISFVIIGCRCSKNISKKKVLYAGLLERASLMPLQVEYMILIGIRPYRNSTCVSHVKFQKHMCFFTCETHVPRACVSHVKFHMWLFTCVSHVKFHMGFFTCEISHVKFHMWKVTYDISRVKSLIWYISAISYVTHLMWKFTCEISHANFHKWNFLW